MITFNQWAPKWAHETIIAWAAWDQFCAMWVSLARQMHWERNNGQYARYGYM